jgi:putative transposase
MIKLSPQPKIKEQQMSRFRKLSQSIWHCQYHIVWVPKYRYKILQGAVAVEVENCIRAFSEQKECEVVELNIQIDHVHLLAMVPPKVSISDYVGILKGRSAIRVFNRFRKLKEKPYWGNSFWARGYCVDTVGLDAEMIQKYVKYQQKKEQIAEQRDLFNR